MPPLETSRPKEAWRWVLIAGAAMATWSAGCRQPARWSPGPEETSSRILCEKVREARSAVEEAAASLSSDAATADVALSQARLSLLALEEYYLPLLEAGRLSHSALRWHQLDQPSRSLEALEEIEEILLRISDTKDPPLSQELDGPLETTVDAQAALRAGRSDAPRLLTSLSSILYQLLLKGGLALQGTHVAGSRWRSPYARETRPDAGTMSRPQDVSEE